MNNSDFDITAIDMLGRILFHGMNTKYGWTSLPMNRRRNMPLLRSLRRDQRALPAIEMALLRSFANRFKVAARVSRTHRLSKGGRVQRIRGFSRQPSPPTKRVQPSEEREKPARPI